MPDDIAVLALHDLGRVALVLHAGASTKTVISRPAAQRSSAHRFVSG